MEIENDIIYGYHGKILRVDLTNNRLSEERIGEEFCRKYMGGAGFVNYYILKEVPPDADPLSPENRLVFANGPISGFNIPGVARHSVGAISPSSNGIAKCESGGFWGAQLKRSGFDAIVIHGKSEYPVYLWVHNGQAELKDASAIWGKETKETNEMILKETGDKNTSIASIGPGAENLVRFACIMNDLVSAAGRGGLGAVMGSKNLKAVAVRGKTLPPVKEKGGIDTLRNWMKENNGKLEKLKDIGTSAGIARFPEIADLPVHNFRDQYFPNIEKITAYTLKETIRTGMHGCFACPVQCKKVVEFEGYDKAYGGPEYETIGTLGSNCDIDDLKVISRAHAMCNANSLDTISTGVVLSFAMECFENGILTKEDTGGIELKFGDPESLYKGIELIIKREGFLGNILAEGSGKAAERIGRGAEKYAMQVKNVEFPAHSPLANHSGAIGYATGAEGPDHGNTVLEIVYSGYITSMDMSPAPFRTIGYRDTLPVYDIGSKKIGFLRIEKLKRYVGNMLIICTMMPYSFEQLRDVLNAVTGWDATIMEMFRVADRVYTMSQLINTRRGFSAKDDTLPDRFFSVIEGGPGKGLQPLKKEEFEKAKQDFYFLMGWDKNAIPHPAKLADLGIEDFM
jgi:aldehyde:ferredoxin oxidoreductase